MGSRLRYTDSLGKGTRLIVSKPGISTPIGLQGPSELFGEGAMQTLENRGQGFHLGSGLTSRMTNSSVLPIAQATRQKTGLRHIQACRLCAKRFCSV